MEKAQGELEIVTKYFHGFTQQQLDQFGQLKELYRTWNNKINVISRKDLVGLYEKHVLHSLSVVAAFNISSNYRILDLGTGGGFPGIPLAIACPDSHFHLIDSIGKKIAVVKSIAAALKLDNLVAEQTRAEALTNQTVDLVVCRAVAPLKDLWTWSKPVLKSTQKMMEHEKTSRKMKGLICLKGGSLEREITESGTQPQVLKIFDIFPEPFFQEKYLLYLPA